MLVAAVSAVSVSPKSSILSVTFNGIACTHPTHWAKFNALPQPGVNFQMLSCHVYSHFPFLPPSVSLASCSLQLFPPLCPWLTRTRNTAPLPRFPQRISYLRHDYGGYSPTRHGRQLTTTGAPCPCCAGCPCFGEILPDVLLGPSPLAGGQAPRRVPSLLPLPQSVPFGSSPAIQMPNPSSP